MTNTTTARVIIQGTWFVMGSEDGAENERPLHRVWIDTFEIASCQVTNAEYAHFAPLPFAGDPKFNDPDQPVVAVSWIDAVRYCQWLSNGTGRRFRLPSEAEWECAARGGLEGRRYPWGDDQLPDYATRALNGPEVVGKRAPNAYGLYDMCENVHEWCSDWYAADYYAFSSDRNPQGPPAGSRRVSRGGSWRHQIKLSRCAARSSIPPEFQYADYGFRVACDFSARPDGQSQEA
jgi:formylglycine-generating enzyme required for sulfatase activity